MTDQPQKAKELFVELIRSVAPEQWEERLARDCGTDEELRRRVRALLKAHTEPGSFLESLPSANSAEAALTMDEPPRERPGTQIGPYKVLQEIGEGGMGVVYMAEQKEPVRRRVALKIIRPGMDSQQVIARFEAERQALAMMDHPNIAKVLDAGRTELGRPYFVMELVKGVPLTQYCDEQHLTPRERLELFIPICQAVQHAHQKGIIHRDLKPSNILIAEYDQRAVPKIIDFGVAKAISQTLTEKTMFTLYGQIVGTWEYMSPEQAKLNQLDIDTRSDVYSLGVILYELLTGSTPFDRKRLRSAAIDELLRIIREEEPPKPSVKLSTIDTLLSVAANRRIEPQKLSTMVRGELDWIAMKALEKDRGRRYETAAALAADVRHYLSDEPVVACPPSAAYRLRKFARRYRAALLTAGLVAAALVAGLIVSAWQAVRATHAEWLAQERLQAEQVARGEAEAARRDVERARNQAVTARDTERQAREEAERQKQRAELALTEARQQKSRAEANYATARLAVDEYLTKVTQNELLNVPGLQDLRQELLAAALRFYTDFTQEKGDDPQLLAELAAAHYRLGRIYSDLGDNPAAKAANTEAIERYEALRQLAADDVSVLSGLADAYFFDRRFNDTVLLCQRILQTAPKHAAVRSRLGDSYDGQAIEAWKQNKFDDALALHRQAFSLREELTREFPRNPAYLANLGATANNLGVLLARQHKESEALAMYQAGMEYAALAYEQQPHSIQYGGWLATGLSNTAASQEQLGQSDEALRSCERLVAVRRKLVFENPSIARLRQDLYRAYTQLAHFQRKLLQDSAASHTLRLAREMLENMPRDTPDQLYQLATVYAELARPLDDVTKLDEAAQAEQKRNADLAIETLQQTVNAGFLNAETLRKDESFGSLRQRPDFQQLQVALDAIASASKLTGQNGGDDAAKLRTRGQAADLLKELTSAQPTALRNARITATTLQSVGELQTVLQQFDAAEKSLQEALRQWQEFSASSGNTPQLQLDCIATQVSLGELYLASDRGSEAHTIWQKCLNELGQLGEKQTGESRWNVRIIEQEQRICRTYGSLGLWPLAAVHSRRNAQLKRAGSPVWDMRFAILLPGTAGEDALREYCRTNYEQSNGTRGRVWSNSEQLHLAWVSGMLNPPALPAEKLLQWTRPIYESSASNSWYGFCMAQASHRAGEHAAALEILNKHFSNTDFDSLGGYATKLGAAYLVALAAQGAGQRDRARQQLQRAESLFDQTCRDSFHSSQLHLAPPFEFYWWELPAALLLRQEAWHAIEGKDATSNTWLHLTYARGYRFLGDAAKVEEELAATDPDNCRDVLALYARAELLQKWGMAARADVDWQRIVEKAGDDPVPWIHQGRFYAALGQQQQAAESFAAAIRSTSGSRPPLAVIPFSSEQAAQLQRGWADHLGVPAEFTNSLGMKFRLIPPGAFDMGTPEKVRQRIVEELKSQGTPAFLVSPAEKEGFVRTYLTAPYYMAECEVTVRQFRQFVDDTGYQTDAERTGIGGFAHHQGRWIRHPSHVWKSPSDGWKLEDEQPVVQVSWNDARAFCNWLKRKESQPYTLPTDAQWEFACRSGSASLYGVGDDPGLLNQIAWTNETLTAEGHYGAQPVGTKQANRFGLHDMLGNAYEWCEDWYAPGPTGAIPLVDPVAGKTDSRVVRGGAWYPGALFARCGARAGGKPDDPVDAGHGFRVAIVGDLKGVAGENAATSRQQPSSD